MKLATFALFLALGLGGLAQASPNEVALARQKFHEGAELVRLAQWAEALAAFEQSLAARAHPVTAYNIAACERALGRYTRAHVMFEKSLVPMGDDQAKLPETLASEARTYLAEIERILVHIELTVDPPEAGLAVDGRPVGELHEKNRTRFVAGLETPGPGRALPSGGHMELLADPGTHVLVLTRKGFSDMVVNKTFAPGTKASLKLELDRLPATLHISTNRPGAVVTVDNIDVGAAPLALSRPAGRYQLQVKKSGFGTYRTHVTVQPGEEANLHAPLEPVKASIVKKWWFWTTLGVVVTGIALGAYFGARAAEEPRIDGGGLQWAVKVQ